MKITSLCPTEVLDSLLIGLYCLVIRILDLQCIEKGDANNEYGKEDHAGSKGDQGIDPHRDFEDE